MRFVLMLAFLAHAALAQAPLAVPASLADRLRSIAAEAHGKVSVACDLPGTALPCELKAEARPPMQSVFKLPLALLVLHMVEQGKLSLDQPIRFRPGDRIPPPNHSPLQDKYPEADVDVPLRSLLRGTVSASDNTAADILLRLAGGPDAVNSYIASLGVGGFHMEDSERSLHSDERRQYRNWFTPAGAVQLLRRIGDSSPLSREHTGLLLEWMRPTARIQRLQAALPEGTVVAHKSGTSGSENGLAPATNDIGLITLPDGRRVALAIFITDSTADDDTRDHVIAKIARAVYDAALAK